MIDQIANTKRARIEGNKRKQGSQKKKIKSTNKNRKPEPEQNQLKNGSEEEKDGGTKR